MSIKNYTIYRNLPEENTVDFNKKGKVAGSWLNGESKRSP